MLIAMAGLPGTGKSAIARRLERELPAIVLDKDRIRAALFGPGGVDYTARQDHFCMQIMMQTASYLLDQDPGRHIILDGRTFSQRAQRAACRAFADQRRVRFEIIECVCSAETARSRLEWDIEHHSHPAENRDLALYMEVKRRFEPIDSPKLVVDTDCDLEWCVARCLAHLRSRDELALPQHKAG